MIYRAEQHGYFKGQIEFLLDFSGVLKHFLAEGICDWGDEQDQEYCSITVYLKSSEAVFNASGLREFPDQLSERALLTQGDYLLSGRSNRSFLDNVDRETSWKRLLRGSERVNDENKIGDKRKLLGKLLFTVDLKDVEGSLRSTIEQAKDIVDWRLPFIKYAEVIGYCEKRYIRKNSDNSIYLMNKTQMNGAHRELWTYFLYLDYMERISSLFPFRKHM